MFTNIFLFIIAIRLNSIASTPNNILTCYYIFDNPPVDRLDAHLCTHVLLIGSTSIRPNGVIQLPPIAQIDQLHRLQTINADLKLLITLCPDNRIMSRLVSIDDWSKSCLFRSKVRMKRRRLSIR